MISARLRSLREGVGLSSAIPDQPPFSIDVDRTVRYKTVLYGPIYISKPKCRKGQRERGPRKGESDDQDDSCEPAGRRPVQVDRVLRSDRADQEPAVQR